MKTELLEILRSQDNRFAAKMQKRLQKILPDASGKTVERIIGQLANALAAYLNGSSPEDVLDLLPKTVNNGAKRELSPFIILSIVLNSRYVLFSIYASQHDAKLNSLETFCKINKIYKPLVRRIRKRYTIGREDIEELFSEDFARVQSLGITSLDYVGIGIFMLDKHFNFIYWSSGLEQLLGIKAADILGTNLIGNCSPFSFENRICEGIRLAIEGGIYTDIISTRHSSEQTREKFFNYIIAPVRSEQKKVIGASVLVHDITQRKESEEKLEKYEQYFQNILNDAADAIFLLDEKDRIVMWNKAAEELYGWREVEVLGEPVSLIVPDDPKSQEEIERIGQIVREKGYVKSVRSQRLTRFGKRVIIEITRTAIRDEKGEYIGSSVITRDITKDEQLREQLVQSEKLSAVGTLAAGIAHEIGSPLMSISSLAQMLQMDSDDENLKDNLRLIQEQIERISRTVRTLVDFSKPIAQKIEKIYLNQVIENVINIVRYDKRLKHQEIVKEFEPDIPLVQASFDQILQVFINLCLNAADAMGNNRNGILRLKTWCENSTVYASVQDNGIGIDPANLPHIFEPFFSTKEKGKGTGLGLWVSYNIVKTYGGDIRVDSTPGQGTTFTISLPVVSEQTEQADHGR